MKSPPMDVSAIVQQITADKDDRLVIIGGATSTGIVI